MPVSKRVRKSVVTAQPTTAAADVAELMSEHKIGCVVIERGGEPVGIVTDRDIVVETIADGIVPPGMTAADIMSRDVVTGDADADVFDLCSEMCEAEVRRMPIVDGGELVGIVTMDDILRQLSEKFRELTDVIAAESPPY
jgi:CBS domain-containing protein